MDNIKNIFKAYDVRGKVGTELNANTVEKIGKAMADWLPDEGPIAVGRDMRPDSEELANAMIKGLTGQGRDVVDIGQVTSDMIYFATGKFGLAGGAVITASHNPGEYNGIKFCGYGAKAIGDDSGLFEIRDIVLADKYAKSENQGRIIQKDIVNDWIDHVIGFIDTNKLKPLKIAVDAGNGMAGKIFPEIEPYIPFEIIEMYFDLDGTFPNHPASPMEPENIKDLIKVVKSQKCHAGIAFDGDGDRAFLVDETGAGLSGGVMSAMLADYFLDRYPKSKIIYDIRNSRTVPNIIKAKGGEPVMTRVGHAPIKKVMREIDAPFGGEASGHFYFRDNYYADSGLIASMIALYVLSLSGKKLSALGKQYTHYSSISETNFKVEDKQTAMDKVAEHFKNAEINKMDGITLTFKDGWINLRPSNTEPLLRLNAEADNQAKLDKYVKEVVAIIKDN